MSDITDVVKALTELAARMRSQAARAAGEPGEYQTGLHDAYLDCASAVDTVMVGPAIQAALDDLDRKEHRAALRGEG